MQVGRLQHLLGFEDAIGLHVDFGDVVLRIFQNDPGNGLPHAEVQRGAERRDDEDLRHPSDDPSLPLPSGEAGTHAHVEHVLIPTLERCWSGGRFFYANRRSGIQWP